MTTQTYKFDDASFLVSTIPSDNDVIISISSYPLGFTMYLSKVDAHALAEQIKAASLTDGDGKDE
jgi:hypothetical protein